MGWAETEFETIDLGDERRNKRAIRLIERLSAQPTASVPQACGDWADTMAAYRFFDNEEVDWRAILGAHTNCAMARMATHEVVLCIQDTTELDFNGQQASGLGPLSYEAQRGMYVHPTYAVSTSREPLGVLDAWECGRAKRAPQMARGAMSARACAGSKATSGWPRWHPSWGRHGWCMWPTGRPTSWR